MRVIAHVKCNDISTYRDMCIARYILSLRLDIYASNIILYACVYRVKIFNAKIKIAKTLCRDIFMS